MRKPFNTKLGYIASRHNMINNGWVVIYQSREQGLDIGAGKYAVVCETHNTIFQTTSLPKARPFLKFPEFCEECMKQYQPPFKVRVQWGENEGFHEVGIYRTEAEALACKKRLMTWKDAQVEILRER